MILRIEPDIGTYLDALMGAYRRDAHVEQRIVEAWLACIAKRGGVTEPSRVLLGSTRKVNAGFERALRAVARALGDADEHAIATSSAHLSTVLIARRVFRGSIDDLHGYIAVLQFATACSAGDRASEVLTPVTARDIAAIGFTETVDRAMYHLARIDATLFELLTRLPVTIEGPCSPQPFPEADLVAAGFPTADERKAWNAGVALPVRALGAPQQPVTRATVHGGRLRTEN